MLLFGLVLFLLFLTFLVSGLNIYKQQREKGKNPVAAFFRSLILLLPF